MAEGGVPRGPGEPSAVRVLHEDERILALDKPAGIPVIPARGEPVHACLRVEVERFLAARDGATPRLWVVHRLDRDVSGVLVLARAAEAHRELSAAFETGSVRKTYWALVDGVPAGGQGRVDLPLRTGGHGGRTVVDHRRGKPSATRWRVVERLGRFAALEVEPETGRTHQVRVHLRALGHPLAVDRRYGRRAALFASDLGTAPPERGRWEAPAGEAPLVERATLHALELVLPAAAGGEPLRLRAPLPPELERLVERLRRERGGGPGPRRTGETR